MKINQHHYDTNTAYKYGLNNGIYDKGDAYVRIQDLTIARTRLVYDKPINIQHLGTNTEI